MKVVQPQACPQGASCGAPSSATSELFKIAPSTLLSQAGQVSPLLEAVVRVAQLQGLPSVAPPGLTTSAAPKAMPPTALAQEGRDPPALMVERVVVERVAQTCRRIA